MKRLILFIINMILLGSIALSQTKFQDIPIAGSKSEMIQKLKSRGFVENKSEGWLEGIYEDKESILIIVTDERNNVVQLDLIYKSWTDNIKAKMIFTNLYYTFQSNIYYKELSFKDDSLMYEATFCQLNSSGIRNEKNIVQLKMIHGNGNKYTIGIFFTNK